MFAHSWGVCGVARGMPPHEASSRAWVQTDRQTAHEEPGQGLARCSGQCGIYPSGFRTIHCLPPPPKKVIRKYEETHSISLKTLHANPGGYLQKRKQLVMMAMHLASSTLGLSDQAGVVTPFACLMPL
jgi:hypothetical protein